MTHISRVKSKKLTAMPLWTLLASKLAFERHYQQFMDVFLVTEQQSNGYVARNYLQSAEELGLQWKLLFPFFCENASFYFTSTSAWPALTSHQNKPNQLSWWITERALFCITLPPPSTLLLPIFIKRVRKTAFLENGHRLSQEGCRTCSSPEAVTSKPTSCSTYLTAVIKNINVKKINCASYLHHKIFIHALQCLSTSLGYDERKRIDILNPSFKVIKYCSSGVFYPPPSSFLKRNHNKRYN